MTIPPDQAQAERAVRQIEREVVYHDDDDYVPRSVAIEAYLRGGLDAIRLYAYWKDGAEYVGSCGTTLAKAARDWIGNNPRPAIKPTTEETDNG